MKVLCILLLLLGACDVYAENNGLGRTPQMAWNSWNSFGCNINQTLIMNTAKAIVSSGLAAAGYEYVNMDDCWAGFRNGSGFVEPDATQFPDGVKALADYVHGLGLKFGLYSDAGTKTCAGRPGSVGYETQDATQYAFWGVDYLKYDDCYTTTTPDYDRYLAMSKALNATGKPIFFSLCNGQLATALWAPFLGNSWRTTTDIAADWDSVMNNLDQSNLVAEYAGPGGWNDPDMLEVGNGPLTIDENIAHFSLWALIKAPLILGNVITEIDSQILKILTNQEVIAINQDPLGVQAIKLSVSSATNLSLTDTLLISAPCESVLTPAQIWTYSNTDYLLTSGLNQMCAGAYMDGWGCSYQTSNGQNIYLQGCNQTCSGNLQKWTLDPTDGVIKTFFQSRDNNACLTRLSALQPDVMVWQCNASDPVLGPLQKWSMKQDGSIRTPDGQCLTLSGGQEIWGGPLSNNEFAAVLFNRAQQAQPITISWSQLGLSNTTRAQVRDLWAQADLGSFAGTYTANVNPHGVNMIKITPS